MIFCTWLGQLSERKKQQTGVDKINDDTVGAFLKDGQIRQKDDTCEIGD